jgi:hypothetical protein
MGFSRRSFMKSAGALWGAALRLPLWARQLPTGQPQAESISLTPKGGNPIIVDKGLCDPQVRIYGDQVYLYATHDAVPGSNQFVMNDWWVWRSSDLVHWKQVSTLRPEETYWGKPCNQCWATDAMTRNGKYYFYFSRGPEEIGVVQSDSPAGPWSDPLHKPLIAQGSTPTLARDPGILQEKDGTSYIVFGCWDYYVAKLNDDMISLAETPRKIILDRRMGPYGAGKMDDKPFLHKRGDFYYLSWGCYYAMSENIYGPYVYKDSIIKTECTAPELQKGLTFDRHGSFFELHNQWYFICNDQSWPGTTAHYRDSVVSYVHYRDNGEIATLDLNLIGVGQYDASRGRINAANYFSAECADVGECADGGFEMREIKDGAALLYPNVKNLPTNATVSFHAACANVSGCSIEIRRGDQGDRQLGTCRIPFTGAWNSYRTVQCKLNTSASKADIRLVIRGGTGELLRLRWFEFT